MKCFVLVLVLTLFCWIPQSSAATLGSFAILDFEENGSIAKGAGKTLSTLLFSSLNATRYHLTDPRRLESVLEQHKWKKNRQLSDGFLKALKGKGIKFVMTGAVSLHYKTFTASYRIINMNGRILHSEVLPSVQSWVGLVSSLRYSVQMLLRRSPKKGSAKKGKAVTNKKKAAKKKKKKKKKSHLKTFASLIKGAKEIKGLFTLYTKKYRGKDLVYMEVNPAQLGKLFLVSPTLEGALGAYPLLTFAQMAEFPIYFKKQNNILLMMQKNVNFRVSPKKAISRVLSRSFTDVLRASTKVLSLPHPKRKTFLVDFNGFFLQDLVKLSYYLSRRSRASRRTMGFDRRHSRFGSLKGFPNNLEIELKAFFRAGGLNPTVVPSGGKVQVTIRYSLSTLPNTGYRPRLADDRVGHFLMVAKDFSDDKADSRFVRYVTRWHLEKKNPKAKLSEPKKPIVFWLGNQIPRNLRASVKKGVLVWNDAFKKIGFKNAMVAKQQPDNAKWDGADVRYNTIRWFLANRAGFAQGPSRINPLTGQIYDADIRVSADMTMYLHKQFELQIAPLQWMRGSSFGSLLMPLLAGSQQQAQLNRLKRVIKHIEKMPQTHKHDHSKNWRFCNYGHEATKQAVLGWHVLNLRGELKPGSGMEKKFIDQFMVSLIAHEVGHTLGLRHNFKASTLHAMKDLHNEKKTKKEGLTNSMMEYSPVNLALAGEKQGEFWQTTLGPYDKWAIEYAYKPLPVKTTKAELPYLKKIASRVADPRLAYATDEDTFGNVSPRSVDPRSNRWDYGKEPLNYYKHRLKIARELWGRVETSFGKKSSSYQKIRRVFSMALSTYSRAGYAATKYVGGLYHHRDHIGDPKGRIPFKPVPAVKQRAALDFMINNYFAKNALDWKPSLLNKLAPGRLRGLSWGGIWTMRLDFPISRVAILTQVMPLYRLLHPSVLERIQDTKLRLPKGAEHLSIAELFQKIGDAVWSEIVPKKPSTQPTTKKSNGIEVHSFRRGLQWFHIQIMGAYGSSISGVSITDAPILAREELRKLQGRIKTILPKVKDPVTRAHLRNCQDRINQLMKAVLIRLR